MKNLAKDPTLFEINDISNMNIIEFVDGDKISNIYWMDNFYKRPDDIVEYLSSVKPPLWKYGVGFEGFQDTTLNTKYFEDRRHMLKHPGMERVIDPLTKLNGQKPCDYDIVTNYTRFSRIKENPYKDHYWWPHHDSGYNGICYLQKHEEIGTNIYKPLIADRPDILPLDENGGMRDEHGIPWTSKKLWEIVLSFKTKYNRFVMFEGSYYYHSMNLTGERYFANHWSDADYRMNQVFFFVNPDSKF